MCIYLEQQPQSFPILSLQLFLWATDGELISRSSNSKSATDNVERDSVERSNDTALVLINLWATDEGSISILKKQQSIIQQQTMWRRTWLKGVSTQRLSYPFASGPLQLSELCCVLSPSLLSTEFLTLVWPFPAVLLYPLLGAGRVNVNKLIAS